MNSVAILIITEFPVLLPTPKLWKYIPNNSIATAMLIGVLIEVYEENINT